jgi:hypothetical protein
MYEGGCIGDLVLDSSVTQINYGTSVPPTVTSIVIPSTTIQIGNQPFTSGVGITAINVDAANPNYKSVDGILYNKSGTTLIQYPQAKTGGSFTIPADVTEIGNYAFSCAKNLNSVTIPDAVTTATLIDRLNGCSENGISEFIVGSGNSNYSSIDGVLYNKTATTLLAYPFNKPGTSYVMPSSVTSIVNRALGYVKNRQLQSITLSPNLTYIDSYSFTDLSLGTLNLPASVTTIEPLGLHGVLAVTVDSGSTHLSVEDGVLYNLNKTRLIYYPNGKNSPSFTIPTTVTQVDTYAFYASSQDLIRLTIGGSLTSVGSNLEIRNLKYLIITGDTSADFSTSSFPA